MPVTVPFHELAGSGKSRLSADGGNADERLFLVPWTQRFTFASEMAGQPHPSLPYCWCNEIAIEPISAELAPALQISDPLTQIVDYLQNSGYTALVRCSYTTDFTQAPWPCDVPKPAYQAGTSLILKCRISTQFLTLPASTTAFAGNPNRYPTGPVPEPDSPAGRLLIPTTEYKVEWYYVNELPIDDWQKNLLGRVNSLSFWGPSPKRCCSRGTRSSLLRGLSSRTRSAFRSMSRCGKDGL